MKTFKQLLEKLKSPEEIRKELLAKGVSSDVADEVSLTRADREQAIYKTLQDPSRTAEQHGQAIRLLRRLGDPTLGGKDPAKRAASKLRRKPKTQYIKTKSPLLLPGKTIKHPS